MKKDVKSLLEGVRVHGDIARIEVGPAELPRRAGDRRRTECVSSVPGLSVRHPRPRRLRAGQHEQSVAKDTTLNGDLPNDRMGVVDERKRHKTEEIGEGA